MERSKELEAKLNDERNSMMGSMLVEYLRLKYDKAKELLVTSDITEVPNIRGRAKELRDLLKILSDQA